MSSYLQNSDAGRHAMSEVALERSEPPFANDGDKKNRIDRLKSPYNTKPGAPRLTTEDTAVKTLNGKSVAHWLGRRLSTLTALEARVISVILSQCTIDDKTLLKMVADETHVSNALLVKIAKKLGFDGFRSLRAALAKQNQFPLAKARQELSDHSTARALWQRKRGGLP